MLKKYKDYTKPLTQNDRKRLLSFKENQNELIDYMFQTGNIEQAEKLIDQLHGLLEELPDSMQEPYNARIVAIRQAQN